MVLVGHAGADFGHAKGGLHGLRANAEWGGASQEIGDDGEGDLFAGVHHAFEATQVPIAGTSVRLRYLHQTITDKLKAEVRAPGMRNPMLVHEVEPAQWV